MRDHTPERRAQIARSRRRRPLIYGLLGACIVALLLAILLGSWWPLLIYAVAGAAIMALSW